MWRYRITQTSLCFRSMPYIAWCVTVLACKLSFKLIHMLGSDCPHAWLRLSTCFVQMCEAPANSWHVGDVMSHRWAVSVLLTVCQRDFNCTHMEYAHTWSAMLMGCCLPIYLVALMASCCIVGGVMRGYMDLLCEFVRPLWPYQCQALRLLSVQNKHKRSAKSLYINDQKTCCC